MRILKKASHSKIDVFVKFESAINLEIRGQIKKKLDSFYLGHRDHMYAFSSKSGSEPFRALGDLTWNDPTLYWVCNCFLYSWKWLHWSSLLILRSNSM